MFDTSTPEPADSASVPEARKPYHAPRLEDYGAVSELTRSGAYHGMNNYDGHGGYGSV